MNKTISLRLIVIGVTLIVFGVIAMDSFSSDVFRLFTGAPTDKSVGGVEPKQGHHLHDVGFCTVTFEGRLR